MPVAFEIDVFRSYSRLFVELNIVCLFVSQQDWSMKMEVDNDDNFIGSTRLVEAILNITETNINLLTFVRTVTKTVLVDFQIANRFLSDEVRSDD